MMSHGAVRPPKTRRAKIIIAIATLDFVLLQFPPLTWVLGHGAVWYFLITSLIAVISLPIMYVLDSSAGED
ncbi:hypothetical protein QN239_22065 [Mycolicibacterium sp. Y3]